MVGDFVVYLNNLNPPQNIIIKSGMTGICFYWFIWACCELPMMPLEGFVFEGTSAWNPLSPLGTTGKTATGDLLKPNTEEGKKSQPASLRTKTVPLEHSNKKYNSLSELPWVA